MCNDFTNISCRRVFTDLRFMYKICLPQNKIILSLKIKNENKETLFQNLSDKNKSYYQNLFNPNVNEKF
jgi:hypothetical protein